ncbi:helix-turn-helix transcriptional regulator [Mycobacterium sp. 141]|uniref:helix-turn-helix domain-containing protein n=1 Tax=Mycobacterium sp. 141 TaxID=1120797 RepID=UPI00035E92B9|nr:helix-turn-helix transcriptional regulator [Mycobacterium sp. 141]
MRQLIQIVQTHMDDYGVSEAEVARRIGATPQTVNTWRNGEMKQLPRRQYLTALAELTQTAYTTVLIAALHDTGYLAEPMSIDAAYTALIISLAVDADELESAASDIDAVVDIAEMGEAHEVITAIRNLVNEVNIVADAIHAVASQVVGGDERRLRQLKREIRRYRREQADLRRLDVSFGTGRSNPAAHRSITPPSPGPVAERQNPPG